MYTVLSTTTINNIQMYHQCNHCKSRVVQYASLVMRPSITARPGGVMPRSGTHDLRGTVVTSTWGREEARASVMAYVITFSEAKLRLLSFKYTGYVCKHNWTINSSHKDEVLMKGRGAYKTNSQYHAQHYRGHNHQ